MIFKKSRLFQIYLISFSLLILAFIISGFNKGFDVTDEGLYLLLLNPFQENHAGTYHYDLFFKLFYQLTGFEFGIVGSRVLRLLSYFIAALSLTFFWKNLHRKQELDREQGLIFLVAIFSGYAFLPPSLSYNSLSVALACLWLSMISYKTIHLSRVLILGFILALLIYVKITAAFCLLILSLILLGYKRQLNWKVIFGLLFPFLLLEGIFNLSIGVSIISRIQESWEMMDSRSDYQLGLLIKNNLVGVFWILLVAIPAYLISKLNSSYTSFLLAIPIVIIGIVFYITLITDEWSHIFMLITAALIAFLVGRFDWKSIAKEQHLLLFFVLILPFALHMGSNVYWLRLGIHYWVFWIIALMFLIGPDAFKIAQLKFAVPIISLLLVFNGIWWKPFGSELLWNFNSKWEYKPGRYILLSQEMHEILSDVKPKLAEIPDSEMIAVYRNPGWMYLLNRQSPKSPGIWDQEQLKSLFPEFPKGLRAILYFPYQELPNFRPEEFVEKEYSFAQGTLKLELRKQED